MIRTVGVLTHERPGVLERCLNSLQDNLERHGRDAVEILVVDDSKPSNARLNRKLVGSRDCARYFGADDKQRMIEHIEAETGGARELLEFAFLPARDDLFCAGANRNVLLAVGFGQRFITADDDSLAESRRRGDPEPTRHRSAPERRPYADRRDLFESVEALAEAYPEVDVDLVGAHEEWLGANGVRVTQSRIAGAPDMPGDALLQMYVQSRNPALLKGIVPFVEIDKARGAEIVTGGDVCYHVCGLDHTEILWPNLPCYEDEDLIFARIHRELAAPFITMKLAVNHWHDKKSFGDPVADAIRYFPARFCRDVADAIAAPSIEEIRRRVQALEAPRDHFDEARELFGGFVAAAPRFSEQLAPFLQRDAYEAYATRTFTEVLAVYSRWADVLLVWEAWMEAMRSFCR